MTAPNLDDFDDAPETLPRRGFSRLILWLVAISLSILFIPLSMASATVQSSNRLLETEISDIQSTLDSPVEPSQEEQTLRSTLSALQEQIKVVEAARAGLAAEHINWPAAMRTIGQYDPQQIIPSGVTQTANRALLTGRALTEQVVMTYTQQLRDSGQFRRVIVQSITIRVPDAAPSRGAAAPIDVQGRFVEFVILLELKVGADE